MDEVLKALVEAAPFGAVCIISLIIMSGFFNKQINVMKEVFDKSISEIKKAYKDINKNKK